MNVVDKIVNFFNPEAGLRRLKSRAMINVITNSGYSESGASRSKRSMKGWHADSESPQDDIDQNLALLRRRSRSLYMNAPIATSAIKTGRTNVIGAGLTVKPKIDYEYLGIQKDRAKVIESQIKREFAIWAKSNLCDSTGLNNFFELQQIAFLNMLLSGEVFALPFYKKNTGNHPYQLRIKLVEADRVTTPDSCSDYIDFSTKAKNGNKIWNGIEIDSDGEAVAYYVCNAYPYSITSEKKEWIRVEKNGERTGNPNILHIFVAERPEQYRGVPFLSPVIETLKQLTRYSDAEIAAAVISGMFTVFIRNAYGDENVDFDGFGDDGKEDLPDYRMGAGMINYLREGESIEIADPKRPNSNYDGFVASFCKYVGAALEIPVDVLLKSYNSSYSASRAALLDAFRSFKMYREWFSSDFCQPIYELFLAEAVSKGYVDAPGFFLDERIRKAYCRSTWNGPAPGQLDPTKEVQAAKLRIDSGLSTAEKEATELNGSDFEQNVDTRKTEIELMKEAGLIREEE